MDGLMVTNGKLTGSSEARSRQGGGILSQFPPGRRSLLLNPTMGKKPPRCPRRASGLVLLPPVRIRLLRITIRSCRLTSRAWLAPHAREGSRALDPGEFLRCREQWRRGIVRDTICLGRIE